MRSSLYEEEPAPPAIGVIAAGPTSAAILADRYPAVDPNANYWDLQRQATGGAAPLDRVVNDVAPSYSGPGLSSGVLTGSPPAIGYRPNPFPHGPTLQEERVDPSGSYADRPDNPIITDRPPTGRPPYMRYRDEEFVGRGPLPPEPTTISFKGSRGFHGALDNSELPDKSPRLPINPKPLKEFTESNPNLADALNQVGKDVGASPYDLAQLVKIQSNGNPQYQDGEKTGYFAITPDEAKQLDPQGQLDFNNPIQNLYLGAAKWQMLQARYGRGSDHAFAAFYAGPDVVDQMLQRPGDQQEIAKDRAPGLWNFLDRVKGYDAPDVLPPMGGSGGGIPAMTAAEAGGGGEDGGETLAQRHRRLRVGGQAEVEQMPTRTTLPPEPQQRIGAAPLEGERPSERLTVPAPQVPPAIGGGPDMGVPRIILPDEARTTYGGVQGTRADAREFVVPPTVVPPVRGPNDVAGVIEQPSGGMDLTRPARPSPPGAPGDYGAAGLEPVDPRYTGYTTAPFTDPMTGQIMRPPPAQTAAPSDVIGPVISAVGSFYNPPPVMPPGPPMSRDPAATFVPSQTPSEPATRVAVEPPEPSIEDQYAAAVRLGYKGTLDQYRTEAEQRAAAPATTGTTTPPPAPAPAPAPTAPVPAPTAPAPAPGAGAAGPAALPPPGTPATPPAPQTQNLSPGAPGTMTISGAVQAVRGGGPEGLGDYVVRSAPMGMAPGNAWEYLKYLTRVSAHLSGDYVKAQHEMEWITQNQHAGYFENMKQAYLALMGGSPRDAAQFLARSHMFVEDGVFARFGVAPDGRIVAQRFSEQTHQPVGGVYMIDKNLLRHGLNITANVQTYLKTMDNERRTNEQIEHNQVTEQQTQEAHRLQRDTTVYNAQAAAAREQYNQRHQDERHFEGQNLELYKAQLQRATAIEEANAKRAQHAQDARSANQSRLQHLDEEAEKMFGLAAQVGPNADKFVNPGRDGWFGGETKTLWKQQQFDRASAIYKATQLADPENITPTIATTLAMGAVQKGYDDKARKVTEPAYKLVRQGDRIAIVDPTGAVRSLIPPQALRGLDENADRMLAAAPNQGRVSREPVRVDPIPRPTAPVLRPPSNMPVPVPQALPVVPPLQRQPLRY